MANYFVSSVDGDDTDDGTTMDNGAGGGVGAWATLNHALEAGGLAAGDIVWLRRTHSETLAAQCDALYDGTSALPIKIIGWPRAADATADQATWTNGSTTVDLVTTLSMSTEAHVSRYVTAPNGGTYLITLVTDSNTFTIDREYSGPTVTTTAGAFTVKADEAWVDDMGTEYGFDDSGWTIKETAWDADADDLPQMEQSAYKIYMYNDDLHWFENIHFTILVHAYIVRRIYFKGCYFDWAANGAKITVAHSNAYIRRCVIKGQSTSTAEYGIALSTSKGYIWDCAIYNMGRASILLTSSQVYIDGLNSAVELGNDYWDINASYGQVTVVAKNAIWGDGDTGITRQGGIDIATENYGKVLGAHHRTVDQGTIIKVDVVAGSGDPYKRPGGGDSVVEILFDLADSTNRNVLCPKDSATLVFEHEFDATTDTKDYRYYVQSEKIITADELWIEVDYVDTYDDATEYTHKKVVSTEAFTVRADAEDWAEYMEVTGITPAVASKVRMKCYCTYYDATDKIYIDPKVVITDG